MYISAIKRNDEVIVWERQGQERVIKRFPAPYYFYSESEGGEYTSIYGKKLVKHEYQKGYDFYRARDEFRHNKIKLYESDITPELKILSKHYYNAEVPKLNITYGDIEVNYNKMLGFSSPMNPYAPINSVALYHDWLNKFVVFCIPPDDSWQSPTQFSKEINQLADIHFCKTERELLKKLLVELRNSDGFCGWNNSAFDTPYICKRIEIVLGKGYLKEMSFEEGDLPKYRDVEIFGNTQLNVDLSGRLNIDYMRLFKKYEAEGRPSYSLESISEEILPNLQKLKYSGSLHDLYRNDFEFFIRYNIRDVECLKGFEEKLGYVKLSNYMYHISTGQFQHIGGTLKLADLSIVNYCHYNKNVMVPDWTEKEDGKIEGALVLMPKIGLQEWVGSIDINSLYPAAIRSINISPETLIGQFIEKIKSVELMAGNNNIIPLTLVYEDGHSESKTSVEWKKFFREQNWAISGYGTVFDQNKQGVIPAILENWYKTRKEHQASMETAKQNKDEDLIEYFDRLQYIFKIKLNSLYGGLSNYHFRFFDLRMGQSTTGTGRMILRHQCAKTTEILDGVYLLPDIKITDDENISDDYSSQTEESARKELSVYEGYSDSSCVIYSDTDSAYFKTGAENKEEAILIADHVAKQVNESYKPFMRDTFLCNDGFDDIVKCSREIVSDRGIFVDKKRYFLHIVDKDGKTPKPEKELKVMGLETKKTTIPKAIAKKLNSFIERFLKGESWNVIADDIVDYKDELTDSDDITLIGMPKGVNKVEKYTQDYKMFGEKARLPGHVAASIHYNECLDKFNDKGSVRISSGMKIRVFYLKTKCGKFRSIALPTDIEVIPEWFIEHFKNQVDIDLQIEKLVDKPIQNIITALGKVAPTKQLQLVQSMFEF